MKSVIRIFMAVFFCVVLQISSVYAVIGALTVGSVVQSISELAKQLEDGAQVLIQQGNTAVAQQQMLAAGILKQLVDRLNDHYKGRLDDTFDKIGTAQSNVALDIENILNQVKGLEGKTAGDAQQAVYQIQGGMNQVLNKIPFVKREPAFYGMVVHDAFSDLPKTGYDVEFLGFNLVDPKLNKAPLITIDNKELPSSAVSVQEDRIQVKLPENFRTSVALAENLCARRSSFTASVKVFYKTSKSFMFIPINRETSVTYNAFALRGPERFALRGNISGTLSSTSNQQYDFSVRSGQITYGCEENNSGGVNYTVPDRATEVNCQAAWVDMSNTKTQGASCAVGGSTITASGTVRGRDRECVVDIITGGLFSKIVGRKTVCNCPGGGHATLALNGTYKLPVTSESEFKNEALPEQKFVSELDLVLPSDDAKRINKVDLHIARDGCGEDFDSVDLNLPKEPTGIATQTSANGHFKATFRSEHLQLEQVEN